MGFHPNRKSPRRIFWSGTQRSQLIVDCVFLIFTAPCGFAKYEDKDEAFAVNELFILRLVFIFNQSALHHPDTQKEHSKKKKKLLLTSVV